jgi:hypothetical protein
MRANRLFVSVIAGMLLTGGANLFWETQVVPTQPELEAMLTIRSDGRLATVNTYPEYRIPTALLDTSAGETLFVPAGVIIEEQALFTMTALARLRVEPRDDLVELTDAQAAELRSRAVHEGDGILLDPGAQLTRFYVVVDPDADPEPILLQFNDGVAFFIGESLLGAASR